MKILQIISGLNVNGAIMYCKFLSEQLQQFGHQLTVLGRPGSWLQENLDPSIQWETSELNRHPAELQRMARWIRQQQFDVIHTHMSRAHSFGVLMRMMTGIPVVATAHQCSLQLHWRLNSHVIANSNWTNRYQRRINRVPASRLDTVHCFTDLNRFHAVQPRDVAIVRGELRLRGDEFLAGVVGDVVAHKGHWYLFQALQEIVEAVPNFQLVLLGRFHRHEAYVRQLRGLQLKHKLFQRVKWLGIRTNIPDFMAAFDLCIVPSLEESLGLVALEALAAGTPVVATDTGGLPEIIEHGVNGCLVPPRSPKHLAAQVIALANDSQRRETFAREGKRLVASSFNPVELARQVESIFFRLADSRRAA